MTKNRAFAEQQIKDSLPIGLTVTEVQSGIGSFFYIYFCGELGDNISIQRKLWIYFTEWYFFRGDEVIGTFFDAPNCEPFSSKLLVGKKLVSVGFLPEEPTVFQFTFTEDLSIQMECYRGDRDGDEEIFLIFDPDEHLVSLTPQQQGCSPLMDTIKRAVID